MPPSLVIFGGAGDLAHRKLLPALYNLHVDGLLPPRIAIVGVGRKAMTDDGLPRRSRRTASTQFSRRPIDEQRGATFAAVAVLRRRATSTASRRFAPLGARLDIIEHERGLPGNRIYYLARAAVAVRADGRAAGAGAVRRPAATAAVRAARSSRSRSATTSTSARAINDAIAEVFDERQIYRIDHYLGKETVQNILVLRFANSIFEPLFNQKYVDHVQITVAEEEGVGTRAGYYEQAGALRDMVQNHMLQLLSLVAMEPPHSLDADVVRDEKLEVLQSLRPIDGDDVDARRARAVRARDS